MVGREGLVGKAEIHGAETAASMRQRCESLRVGDERRERVGSDEARDLAGSDATHLLSAFVDEGPIEIDDVTHGRDATFLVPFPPLSADTLRWSISVAYRRISTNERDVRGCRTPARTHDASAARG